MAGSSTIPGYENFELLIGPKTPDGYPVTITQAPAGEDSGFCTLDIHAPALRKLLDQVENDEADEAALVALGRQMYDSLFSGPIGQALNASLSLVRGRGQRLRIHLRFDTPELAALPWEFLYKVEEDSFLPTSPETVINRYIPMGVPARPTTIQLPLRVLVVLSNPSDWPSLDMEKEKGLIEQALGELSAQGKAQVLFVDKATVAEISQALRSFQPHVFHFIGHAMYEDDQGYALLENDKGESHRVDERAFRDFFSGAPDIRLAVLNACQSASTSESRTLAGLGPRLLERQLSAVVAMQYLFPDQAAVIFSREFYRSLAAGLPVDAALAEARRGIFMELGRATRDWAAPVLFMRARDGLLFNPAQSLAEPAAGQSVQAAGQAVSALARLLETEEVRNAVFSFQSTFQAANQEIGILAKYKKLHDLFQELENSYFLIEHDRRRLESGDDSAWDSLELNEPETRSKITSLLEIAADPVFSSEDQTWLPRLTMARDSLRTGVDAVEVAKVTSATKLLTRVLDTQPSRINERLVEKAGKLGLHTLAEAMSTINQRLESQVPDKSDLEALAGGVQAIQRLDGEFTALVASHNSWQSIDDELRRLEANLEQAVEELLMELEIAWPIIQGLAGKLFGESQDDWAVALRDDSVKIDESIKEASQAKIKRFFRRFRSGIGRRFRQVDQALLDQCQDLQKLGDSLTQLLGSLKSKSQK